MALLASILIINPGTAWLAQVENIPTIPVNNVAIPPIELKPPLEMADQVRPIRIYQVTEIYTP